VEKKGTGEFYYGRSVGEFGERKDQKGPRSGGGLEGITLQGASGYRDEISTTYLPLQQTRRGAKKAPPVLIEEDNGILRVQLGSELRSPQIMNRAYRKTE